MTGEPAGRADDEGSHRQRGLRVDDGRLQEAEGGGGGLQRRGEEPARLRAADVAGAGERLHPRQPRPDGGVRRLHSRVWHRAA